jgi:ABC-type transport system involved in Fe-S cluster assembly fused permease/ATPase subunit
LRDAEPHSADSPIKDSIDNYADSLPQGLTRIIIAHRLSTVKSADAIALVKNGKVVELGSHNVSDMLVTSPSLTIDDRILFNAKVIIIGFVVL